MAFTRGDEYLIPIIIKQEETVITPEIATGVKVGLGPAVSTWPGGSLTFSEGIWYFPLSEEISYRIPRGRVDFQVKVTVGNQIVSSDTTQVDVYGTVFNSEYGKADKGAPPSSCRNGAAKSTGATGGKSPIFAQIKTAQIRGGGGGDKFFEYEQMTPEDQWRIVHPLDKFPSVTVVDSGGNVVVGDVEYVDKATIVLTFQSAFSGKAYLN